MKFGDSYTYWFLMFLYFGKSSEIATVWFLHKYFWPLSLFLMEVPNEVGSRHYNKAKILEEKERRLQQLLHFWEKVEFESTSYLYPFSPPLVFLYSPFLHMLTSNLSPSSPGFTVNFQSHLPCRLLYGFTF